MIYKDYIVEKNVDEIKENIVLFYGENNGKKEDLKKNIKQKNRNLKISRNFQNEILKNEDLFLEDLFNKSLFDDTKIYFIENVDDKILDLVQNFIDKIDDQKIYFFSDILDKKSKLRNYCEKNKKVATIACYNDNEISLRKIISSNLDQLNGLTPNIINIIINNSQMDRVKLNNELEKIKSFFFNKRINEDDLLKLLNLEENDDFQALRDAALNGNKKGNFKEKQVDANILKAQERIERILGLKINILNKKNNCGKVVIEYKDLEQFELISNLLTKH